MTTSKKLIFEPAERIFKLPEPFGDLFSGLIRRVTRRGLKIYDLGRINICFPDQLKHLLHTNKSEIWGDASRLAEFERQLKAKIAAWLARDYEIDLDPETEMLLTTGNTPGAFMAFMSLFDGSGRVFIPDPAFPLYRACAVVCGVETETYSVSEVNDFQPNLERIRARLDSSARAIVVNYPHNPTARGVDLKFYNRLSSFAKKHNLIVLADSVYLLHGGDGFTHPLYLQSEYGRMTGMEFITFSFLFNLPAFKIGVVVGHRDLISPLAKFRTTFNLIPSVFDLEIADRLLDERAAVHDFFSGRFAQNRSLVYSALDDLGWEYLKSNYAPFVWIKLPRRRRASLIFCRMLLKRTGVVLLPGSLFGDEGEGFIRLALGQSPEMLKEAFERINNYPRIYKIARALKAGKKADG